jgi:hypothetical protein
MVSCIQRDVPVPVLQFTESGVIMRTYKNSFHTYNEEGGEDGCKDNY